MTNLEIIRAWRKPQIKLEAYPIKLSDLFTRFYMYLNSVDPTLGYNNGKLFSGIFGGDKIYAAFEYIYGEDFSINDFDYFTIEYEYVSRSGEKEINRNSKRFILANNVPDDPVTDAESAGHPFDWDDSKVWSMAASFPIFLGTELESRFGDELRRIAETLTKEYDPASNYDMEEKETPDITITNDARTKSKTESEAHAKVFGFNSSEAVPASDTKGESTTSGLLADNHAEQKTSGTRTLTRKGNIGVTTGAQLVTGELDLRKKNRFLDYFFGCVDKILVQGVYYR